MTNVPCQFQLDSSSKLNLTGHALKAMHFYIPFSDNTSLFLPLKLMLHKIEGKMPENAIPLGTTISSKSVALMIVSSKS